MKRMASMSVLLLGLAGLPAGMLLADEVHVGDCVVFREGGEGRLLKAPVYWLKGSVVALSPERRLAEMCPVVAKPRLAYTRDERVRLAQAMPCVQREVDIREVVARFVHVSVDSWETPWSSQHGTAGLLFRGTFLDQPLVRGGVVKIDADWLESCDVVR